MFFGSPHNINYATPPRAGILREQIVKCSTLGEAGWPGGEGEIGGKGEKTNEPGKRKKESKTRIKLYVLRPKLTASAPKTPPPKTYHICSLILLLSPPLLFSLSLLLLLCITSSPALHSLYENPSTSSYISASTPPSLTLCLLSC